MATIDNVKGNYRFLPGIAPFSSGAIAMPGSSWWACTARHTWDRAWDR